MKRIGITGGIGMGKSTAVRFLRAWNLPVTDTDETARALTQAGTHTLEQLVGVFGAEILGPDGSLNRAAMAKRVFGDAGARTQLEAVLHPAIRKARESDLNEWSQSGVRVGFVVIPLLFEKGYETCFESVVCVACSGATQRMRWRERGWCEDEGERRSLAQMAVGEKILRSHVVIWTEGSFAAHEDQWRQVLPRWGGSELLQP